VNTSIISTFTPNLSDAEFDLFRKLIMDQAGISLTPMKKSLVENRLSKRLRALNLTTYKSYHKKVISDASLKEMQILVDLLTTNETYFFREKQHFDYLKNSVLTSFGKSQKINIWCAASSSGEEPYSIAMTSADCMGITGNWNIIATDINTEVLNVAQTGKYTLCEKNAIPTHYLNDYCLKGIRSQEGSILINKAIRAKLTFSKLNLIDNWNVELSYFDIIFIRNVMIYFDTDTRIKLIDRLAERLKMGGFLFISHSETLHNLSDRFKLVQPSVYVRVK